MHTPVPFDSFREEWTREVVAGSPGALELGRRFAQKLITQWLDQQVDSDDIVYCDGTGDGGIDIAILDRVETDDDDGSTGHTWFLVQSKYGRAFSGSGTLLAEGQKVVDTLEGKRTGRLSSLAEGLLEKLTVFRRQASERDRIVLVFATEQPLTEEQRRTLADVRAMGRERLGASLTSNTSRSRQCIVGCSTTLRQQPRIGRRSFFTPRSRPPARICLLELYP